MDEKLDKAIETLAGKIVQTVKPDEALKYTQAALNLAHVKGILTAQEKDRTRTKRASA